MRVDFYQLSRDPAETALPLLARATLKSGERMLVVSADPAQRERIGQALWAVPDSFLANGAMGEGDEDRQPILLSDSPQPANGARYLAITDGMWREGETPFARTFFLFDETTITAARDVWRMLREREGTERHYWKQEGGRWIEAG